jgi:predicted dehydrogenase
MSTAMQDLALSAVPRLGFLGVGWIGRSRMESLVASGAGAVHAVADTEPARAAEAARLATGARCEASLEALLDHDLDGVVVATPSALHAAQCIQALERGVAVFCQKPLGRTAAETRAVVDAARAAGRLLGIDLSYRYTAALQAVRAVVRSGEIGEVFAADLVFHNAYGPDIGWARDPALAGGGCVIDLGVHLVDMALWTLDFPVVTGVTSQLFARGQRLWPMEQTSRLPALSDAAVCEDHVFASVELSTGATVRIACSWECSTGQDAVIEARFSGSGGTAALRNTNGSFHDFAAELYHGTAVQTLATPPDEWGGRALIDWSRRLGAGAGYDPAVEQAVTVAATLDAILGR